MLSDKEIREQILKDNGNVIVSAGAGSGKTTLLVKKILEEGKAKNSHYGIAAITFTNKSAADIKEKLGSYDRFKNFVGTADSFVESEVIRPFIVDAFGKHYSDNFKVDYYRNKFRSAKKGLEILRNKNVLGTFERDRDQDNHFNKMNFKFQVAVLILENSLAARQYIKAKYRRLYVDEYQDTDLDMNKFYLYLKDKLGIKLFFVGDLKQSIYKWRGAQPENFRNLLSDDSDFNKYELTVNFRCAQDIQNYSKLFIENEVIEEKDEITSVLGIYSDFDLPDVVNNIMYNKLLKKKTFAILVRNNNQAKQYKEELTALGKDFTYIPPNPLDVTTPNVVFLRELVKYIKNENYSLYELQNNIYRELSKDERTTLKTMVEKLETCKDKDSIDDCLIEIYGLLGMGIYEGELDNFSSVLLTDEYDSAFDTREKSYYIMTIHSAKGLEFDNVLYAAGDLNLWEDDFSNLHYVAITRAIEKLFVIIDSREYEREVNKLIREKEIEKIMNVIQI
ncbi:ATP-dependent helicase [Bacillus inaquosorum]|uniref:ATP-dependent helicase n=2 Tax=Bacillus subtilis group TaxID=653685 RepID=A0A9Q4HUA5_9BACI|nr:ATP-dependent helicase [Bacillus inaquosorum]MCY7787544.1 ATP-dependent helicase [Bacillus inaquosorum]MCY7820294.1 ATP-dependent helicase [Bacillus inaquosorum]MCY7938307.1 ATP-dependent helicase [Bacillus inaquosorum]MCY8084414.1 ATP-dependent helicase [Bacillus inaquosorum]MCY8162574.1 ATP-dependent helicase [Bacillus inaquosorum]